MPNQIFIDYYCVLEVSPNSSHDQIKAQYKILIKKNHPDKNDNTTDSIAKSQLINEAYRILKNQNSRRLFDIEKHIYQESISSDVKPTIRNKKSTEYKYSNDELKDYILKAKKQAAQTPIISEKSKAIIITILFFLALTLVILGNIIKSKEIIIAGGITIILTAFPFLAVIGTILGKFYKNTFYFWMLLTLGSCVLSIYLYKKFDDAGPLFCILIFLTFPSFVIGLAKRK